MSATTVAQAIAILIYLVLSKIYSTSEHGVFALFMSIIAVTGIISTGKYESAVMMPADEKKAMNLVALSSSLCTAFSIFLLILVVIFHHGFTKLMGEPLIEKWLWFVPLSTFMIGHFQSLSYWSNRHKLYGSMAVANVSQSLTNSAVKVSTSKVFSNGGGLIAGAIIGQLTGLIYFAWDFFRRNKNFIQNISIGGMKEMAGEYKLFPRFNMIHNLINNFSANLPIFLITSKFGSSQAGLYSFAFLMVFRPVNLVTGSFSQVFSQRIISSYNHDKKIFPDVRRLVIKLFQLGILPFLAAGIAGPYIFTLVFGEYWTEAGRYMQILLPWIFMVLISSPISFLSDMLNKQQRAMWLDVIKISARIPALAIGVYYNNIYLAVILYSLVSTISVAYSLYWYMSLARKADETMHERIAQNLELPISLDVKEL